MPLRGGDCFEKLNVHRLSTELCRGQESFSLDYHTSFGFSSPMTNVDGRDVSTYFEELLVTAHSQRIVEVIA